VREFGELEMAIMDVMWAAESPCVVREVRERLRYDRPVAYTTVMTVMTEVLRSGGNAELTMRRFFERISDDEMERLRSAMFSAARRTSA